VQDVHNLHAFLQHAVENHVLSNRKAAISRSQVVAEAASLGVLAEQAEMLRQQLKKAICSVLIVVGDVVPDSEQVTPCLPSYAVGHAPIAFRSCARPSRLISSASSGSESSV